METEIEVWITQYWGGKGIYKCKVWTTDNDNIVVIKKINGFKKFFSKPDWHLIREEAVNRANECLQKKINELKTKLTKLEARKFE